MPSRDLILLRAKRFSNQSLPPVPHDRVARLFRNRDAQSRSRFVALDSEQYQHSVGRARTFAQNQRELLAADHTLRFAETHEAMLF